MPIFQSFDVKDHGYASNDSSLTSSKESLFSQIEIECSDAIIISIMMTKVANLKELITSMKAMLERLSKESLKKDAQIKR